MGGVIWINASNYLTNYLTLNHIPFKIIFTIQPEFGERLDHVASTEGANLVRNRGVKLSGIKDPILGNPLESRSD